MIPRRLRSRKCGIMIIIVLLMIMIYFKTETFFQKKSGPLSLKMVVENNHNDKPADYDMRAIPQANLMVARNSTREKPWSPYHNETEIRFPENRPLNGYLVYDCSNRHPGLCGGWSDRISGILSIFGVAIISRRHFKINHDRPCTFENLLEPNMYDWKMDESKTPSNAKFMYLIDNNSYNLRENSVKTNLENYFTDDVTLIRMNWDMTRDFRMRPNIAEDFPWVTKLQYADIYSGLYHYLFKPGKKVLEKFDDIQKRRKHELLACSHARAGDIGNAPRNFTKIWNFLSKLNRSKYDIFIASDQQYVRDAGIKYLQGYDIVTTEGQLGNMDHGRGGCDVFTTSMIDFYTLTTCDLLVITNSGFSIMSAYVRQTSNNLYCMGDSDVFPCSRNILEDVYPGNMLAPPLKLH